MKNKQVQCRWCAVIAFVCAFVLWIIQLWILKLKLDLEPDNLITAGVITCVTVICVFLLAVRYQRNTGGK